MPICWLLIVENRSERSRADPLHPKRPLAIKYSGAPLWAWKLPAKWWKANGSHQPKAALWEKTSERDRTCFLRGDHGVARSMVSTSMDCQRLIRNNVNTPSSSCCSHSSLCGVGNVLAATWTTGGKKWVDYASVYTIQVPAFGRKWWTRRSLGMFTRRAQPRKTRRRSRQLLVLPNSKPRSR